MKNLKTKTNKTRNDGRPNGKAWSARAVANRAAQAIREQANRQLLANNPLALTPWEVARDRRAKLRAAKRQQIHAPAKGLTA